MCAMSGHSRSNSLQIPNATLTHGRTPSTSSLQAFAASQAAKKKVVTACQRCRTRKIKCDGVLPSCGACTKAGVPCVEVDKYGIGNLPRSHVYQLENRIKWLEGIISTRLPDVDLNIGPQVELRSESFPPATLGTGINLPDISVSATTSESSGFSPLFSPAPSLFFASDNLPQNPPMYGVSLRKFLIRDPTGAHSMLSSLDAVPLPGMEDMERFTGFYFRYVHLEYPFLVENDLKQLIHLLSVSSPTTAHQLPVGYSWEDVRFQVYLVLAIGSAVAKQPQMSSPTGPSERYFYTALRDLDSVNLNDNLVGLQNGLLLAVAAIYLDDCTSNSLIDIWVLNAIIASACFNAELHLHPNSHISITETQMALRQRVFWSAYNIDKVIGKTLRRPFMLSDEDIVVSPLDISDLQNGQTESILLSTIGTLFISKVIKMISNIRSTLHSYHRSAIRDELSEWQLAALGELHDLRAEAQKALSAFSGNPDYIYIEQTINIRTHEAIQFLFRPFDSISYPEFLARRSPPPQQLVKSAAESLRILVLLGKSGRLMMTWTMSQAAFEAGLVVILMMCRSATATIASGGANEQSSLRGWKELLNTSIATLSDFSQKFTSAQGKLQSLILWRDRLTQILEQPQQQQDQLLERIATEVLADLAPSFAETRMPAVQAAAAAVGAVVGGEIGKSAGLEGFMGEGWEGFRWDETGSGGMGFCGEGN